jgi:hypothetical protein
MVLTRVFRVFSCVLIVIHVIIMPKAKPSKSCHLKQIAAEFRDDIFSADGEKD